MSDNIIGLKSGYVKLLSHRSEWEQIAADTISLLRSIIGDICIDIQHVGSTAIKGIYAKPIIDIAVAVNELTNILPYIEELEQNGISYRKEEHTGQLLFIIKDSSEDIKTHHIHVVRADSTNWENYLNFRDYLNAFHDKAEEYNALKLSLAAEFRNDRKAYTASKAELIGRLLCEARRWRNRK